MERPSVDVVVPFAGSPAALEALLARLTVLELRPRDTVTVVDNRPREGEQWRSPKSPRARFDDPPQRALMAARERRGSYHARNRGAARGAAPWLLFVDADVELPRDLLDAYFHTAPGERTAVLGGAIRDLEPRAGAPAAVRYAWLRESMSQQATLERGDFAFAQTANCAVRRDAFEALGGFGDALRSGGDADLCFRLRAAGWELESRPEAAVVHRNRAALGRMLAQRARHGAGAAWLERRHPGAAPRRRWPGLAWWATRRAGAGLAALARGDRDAALLGLLDGPAVWAFELGRLLPNQRR